jgi:hypothetical protein
VLVAPGGGRLAKAATARISYTILGSGPANSRFTVTAELTIYSIVSIRTIELLITEVCAMPNSVLFEDDEAD